MLNQNPLRWIKLKRCLTNFRVCTLILFMNLGTVILIIPIIVGLQQININLLNSYFEEFAIEKFMQQSQSNLNIILSSYVTQFRNTLNRTEIALLKVQNLYLIKANYQANIDPDMCHTQFADEDTYKYVYKGFCVNIYDIDFLQYNYLPEKDTFKSDYNFVSLLNEYLLVFDPSQQFLPDNIYFTKIDREFTAWWPQWNRIQDYHPSKRPWYVQHLAHYKENPSQQCFLSDFYQFYASYPVVAVTMTCSLLDDQDNLIGILASDMQFLSDQYAHPRLNIMIVNEDGMLIMTTYQNENLANSTVLGSFYEENMTGFNIDDWEQIKNYAKSSLFSSNCQTFPSQDNILCRYNSILKCDIIMSVYNLTHPNYIFILQNQISQQIQQFN